MAAAGFTGGQAEQLRRAMVFKRSISSFALYGFPESHPASCALLASASLNPKAHCPAEFLAPLLNSQPMGFYSPGVAGRPALRQAAPAGASRRPAIE